MPETFNTMIDTISVDASISERHGAKVVVTKHPIEAGANPTDHAREEPEALQMTGFITGVPLNEYDRTLRNVRKENTLTDAYVKQQVAKLYALKKKAVTVRTAFRTYDNMVMTTLDFVRDAKQGFSAEFTATFEQVRFVASELVRLQRQVKPTKVPKKPTGTAAQAKKVGSTTDTYVPTGKRLLDSLGVTKPGSGLPGGG
jgi:hypothetical protein